MRNLIIAVGCLFGLGSVGANDAFAQYTVYIANVNNPQAGWIRSGTWGETFTSKQACLSAIARRVADNKRFGQDTEAFAVVRTNQRPGWGQLNRQNVPGGRVGQMRYWTRNTWYNVTISNTPTRTEEVGAPERPAITARREEIATV